MDEANSVKTRPPRPPPPSLNRATSYKGSAPKRPEARPSTEQTAVIKASPGKRDRSSTQNFHQSSEKTAPAKPPRTYRVTKDMLRARSSTLPHGLKLEKHGMHRSTAEKEPASRSKTLERNGN